MGLADPHQHSCPGPPTPWRGGRDKQMPQQQDSPPQALQRLCKGLSGAKTKAVLRTLGLTNVPGSCRVWQGVGVGDRKPLPENSEFWVCWIAAYDNSRVYRRSPLNQKPFSSQRSHSQNFTAERTNLPEKEGSCQPERSIH